VISGECEKNVEWETPLGLPVVQPYTRLVSRTAAISIDDKKLLTLGRRLRTRENVRKVNTLKHKAGDQHTSMLSMKCTEQTFGQRSIF
jgi:hypothetical protein